jgi:hypothetical protein
VDEHRLRLGLDMVEHELRRAVETFPAFNSPHEGWAVIHEELEELWETVRANGGRGEAAAMEAVQVAAMALRFVLDCGPAL